VLWTVLRVVLALTAMVVLYVVGAAILRKFKIAAPPEPDPADLRPVDVRFRCVVCGAEVTMTMASGDDPEPPRHCREDMALFD
jgi:hypothetical protein